MYPAQELIELAARKATLRARLVGHRAACVIAATRAAQPLARLDQLVAWGKQLVKLVPLIALPAALLAARAVTSRSGWLRKLFHWGPLVFGALRTLRSR